MPLVPPPPTVYRSAGLCLFGLVVSVEVVGRAASLTWSPNFENVGMMQAGGEEASPLWLNKRLYFMHSVMGHPDNNPGNGAHSYFCVHDATTGEVISCPDSSSGWAFCSAMVDRTATPNRAWVFCSAWDRANHTVNGQNHTMRCDPNASHWGCGGCALAEQGLPGPGCSVGSWSSTDLVNWDGPRPAVTLPGNKTVPNVGVTMIPPASRSAAAAQTGLPPHQAFMALETHLTALAVNIGTDGDLSKNWVLVPTVNPNGQYASFDLACPTTRYNPDDSYYYVFGGGNDIMLTRSRDLKTWTPANKSIATGCIATDTCLRYRRACTVLDKSCAECCADKPGWCTSDNSSRIAPGYFTHYWSNYSDCRHTSSSGQHTDCNRDFLVNETEWNWSVNDADFTDEGGKGPTRFIFDLSQQTKPTNFTGKGGGGYQVGIFPGTELEFLSSFYEQSRLTAKG